MVSVEGGKEGPGALLCSLPQLDGEISAVGAANRPKTQGLSVNGHLRGEWSERLTRIRNWRGPRPGIG